LRLVVDQSLAHEDVALAPRSAEIPPLRLVADREGSLRVEV
jgi:hypothetical protein